MKRIPNWFWLVSISLIFASCQQIESASNLKQLLPQHGGLDETRVRVDDMILEREFLEHFNSTGQALRSRDLELPFQFRDDFNIQGAGAFSVYGSRPWKNGILPIQFAAGVSQKQKDLFLRVVREWEVNTPVKVQLRTNQTEYLLVKKDEYGCFSDVGASPGRVRVLNLSETCWTEPIVLHEVGHALGLMHEHQRPDRNQFLKINLENADPQYAYAFDLFSLAEQPTAYDFRSIMHYSQNAFSKNGKPTLLAKPPFEKYQRVMGIKKISELDRQAIRALYQR